jgi:hypothetical protein
MTTQHTPGPWHWEGNPCNYDKEQEAPWLVDANYSFPPILGGTITCQSDANARLIAAAPELLSALNAMLTHMGIDEDEWNKPTFDQARAAIAKATGAQA